MVKLSANVSMMFTEYDFLDRFAAARHNGFESVEFLFPYSFPLDDIAREISDTELNISVFNMPPGDWTAGDRGLAAVPGREDEFIQSIEHTLPYALKFGAKQIHCMAGITPRSTVSDAIYIANIRRAADMFAQHGIRLLIEAINLRDMPEYYLSSTGQAVDIIDEIDHPNVALQFDIYHHQMTEGDVITTLEKIIHRVQHIQIAGVPGRNEPNLGTLDYGPVFSTLDRLGYDGWVGCEYRPQNGTVAGLSWREKLL